MTQPADGAKPTLPLMRVMLDLETFGQKPGCIIVAIGAVKFGNGQIQERFYERIDPLSCERAGLHAEIDTVLWWMRQPDAARLEIVQTAGAGIEEAVELERALQLFSAWLRLSDVEIWGNGSSFDIVILEAAYDALKMVLPWHYSRERCYRTVRNYFRDVPMIEQPKVVHNALDDAEAQAIHLMAIEAAHPPMMAEEI